jgi:hypothetical protein
MLLRPDRRGEWSEEEMRALADYIMKVAYRYIGATQQPFPNHTLSTGNNWIGLMDVLPLKLEDVPLGHVGSRPLVFEGSESLTIKPVGFYGTPEYVEIDRIFDGFPKYLGSEFAFFPIGDKRRAEIDLMEPKINRSDDWYDLRLTDGRLVRVFPLEPHEKTAHRIAEDGTRFGYTPLTDDVDQV